MAHFTAGMNDTGSRGGRVDGAKLSSLQPGAL
jgi:hypothetical protein